MIDTGDYVAYAFYSLQLHAEQPASTFAFSKAHWSVAARGLLGRSGIINILWHGVNAELTEAIVRKHHPDAEYKGVLSSKNYLLMPGQEPFPVIGEPVQLDLVEDGPIRRPEAPQRLRLVVNNRFYEPRSA